MKYLSLSLLCCLVLLSVSLFTCSDETSCTEGETEVNGPRCCAGYCGSSTLGWRSRICSEGKWVCEKGVVEDACASEHSACTIKTNCSATVGMNREEPDPVPELCCMNSCKGTKAVKRICKSGLEFECPAGAVPISKACKTDFNSACGGILQKYRDNNYKLPK